MKNRVLSAVDYLRSKWEKVPTGIVVLGSGLGAFADSLKNKIIIPYGEIPGWPLSTAPGHAGKLAYGVKDGLTLAVMQGRPHYYEGYSMEEVVFPVRVFASMGVKIYVATNASGGICPGLASGTLVLIEDHINWMGANPLQGPDTPDWNPRFPDMTRAYDPALMERMERAAAKEGIPLTRGVYIAFSGPSFETPAEIRMARLLGATVVGMSTVPEVIVANAMGMKVCALSCVANAAAGVTNAPLSGDDVIREMGKASKKLIRLLDGFFSELKNHGYFEIY